MDLFLKEVGRKGARVSVLRLVRSFWQTAAEERIDNCTLHKQTHGGLFDTQSTGGSIRTLPGASVADLEKPELTCRRAPDWLRGGEAPPPALGGAVSRLPPRRSGHATDLVGSNWFWQLASQPVFYL